MRSKGPILHWLIVFCCAGVPLSSLTAAGPELSAARSPSRWSSSLLVGVDGFPGIQIPYVPYWPSLGGSVAYRCGRCWTLEGTAWIGCADLYEGEVFLSIAPIQFRYTWGGKEGGWSCFARVQLLLYEERGKDLLAGFHPFGVGAGVSYTWRRKVRLTLGVSGVVKSTRHDPGGFTYLELSYHFLHSPGKAQKLTEAEELVDWDLLV